MRSRRSISWAELPAAIRERVRQASPGFDRPEKSPTKQKYHAIPVTDKHGILYDSKTEREWPARLDLMVSTGQIGSWSYGPRFLIQGPSLDRPDIERITYRPDFLIWNKDSTWWVLDAKGVLTREFKRVAKLWRVIHPHNPLRVGFKDGSIRELD